MGVPGSGANADTGAVVLGLQTLGSFDFEGHSLLGFVQHCATHYLHSEEKLIRSYNFIHMVFKICLHCFSSQKQTVKHCCCLWDEILAIYRQYFEIYR